MSIKAILKVLLLADEVAVAESDDPALWQKVLVAIHGGKAGDRSGVTAESLALDEHLAKKPGLADGSPIAAFRGSWALLTSNLSAHVSSPHSEGHLGL